LLLTTGLDRPATGRKDRINHLKSTYHGFKGAGLQEKKEKKDGDKRRAASSMVVLIRCRWDCHGGLS
jgi:hypothetical protein